MKNDLMIINNIENKLRTKRKETDNIFPLSPTHRKELRLLKSSNIGELYNQLDNIKKLKKEEFKQKYFKIVLNKCEEYKKDMTLLNEKYHSMIDKINSMIEELKECENKTDMQIIDIKYKYDTISSLNKFGYEREYIISKNNINKILEKMFNEKFNKKFNVIKERIEKMSKQYEEAINFGDLEIVKELYYMMKDTDIILNEASKIKV